MVAAHSIFYDPRQVCMHSAERFHLQVQSTLIKIHQSTDVTTIGSAHLLKASSSQHALPAWYSAPQREVTLILETPTFTCQAPAKNRLKSRELVEAQEPSRCKCLVNVCQRLCGEVVNTRSQGWGLQSLHQGCKACLGFVLYACYTHALY